MKRMNAAYVAAWYGSLVVLTAVLIAVGFVLDLMYLAIAGFFVFAIGLALIPFLMRSRMEKKASALERQFPAEGFVSQYKFSSNSGVFYIDPDSRRLGIVWKNNPSELNLVDLSNITDVRTHDGKQLKGTSHVSCRFKLDGKTYRIYTLRVSNGQLSMKSPQVLEAVSKADKLCEMLKST